MIIPITFIVTLFTLLPVDLIEASRAPLRPSLKKTKSESSKSRMLKKPAGSSTLYKGGTSHPSYGKLPTMPKHAPSFSSRQGTMQISRAELEQRLGKIYSPESLQNKPVKVVSYKTRPEEAHQRTRMTRKGVNPFGSVSPDQISKAIMKKSEKDGGSRSENQIDFGALGANLQKTSRKRQGQPPLVSMQRAATPSTKKKVIFGRKPSDVNGQMGRDSKSKHTRGTGKTPTRKKNY